MKLDTPQICFAVIVVFMLSSIDPASNVGLPLSPRSGGSKHEVWCYTKPECDQKNETSPWNTGTCLAGKKQSPINLVVELKAEAELETTWEDDRANYKFTQFKMENNGHTVMLSELKTKDGDAATFSWPEKNNNAYKLEQIHFHWGENDHRDGSEHYVNNKSHSMEMHLVHFKVDGDGGGYSDIGAAIASRKSDALAVIGVFLHVGGKATTVFNPVIDRLPDIPAFGNHTTVTEALELNVALEHIKMAFTYDGSLTTPGCNEQVAWLVCKKPINVASEDVKAFRELIKDTPETVTRNYRNLQARNERTVKIIRLVAEEKIQKDTKLEHSTGTSINTCLSSATIIIITSVFLFFN